MTSFADRIANEYNIYERVENVDPSEHKLLVTFNFNVDPHLKPAILKEFPDASIDQNTSQGRSFYVTLTGDDMAKFNAAYKAHLDKGIV